MKKHTKVIAILGIALAALSCEKEPQIEKNVPSSGRAVNFTISSDQTRTVYDAQNDRQILWVDGDKVRIFCDQAEWVKEADYQIVDHNGTKDGQLRSVSDSVLKWGGNTGDHTFYAVYPSDAVESVEDGKATFKVRKHQTCRVTTGAQGGNSGVFKAEPDMTNAYMVAATTTQPTDQVALSFKPIMTTLNIIVKAADATSTGNNNLTRITAVSVIKENARTSYRNSFSYDLAARAMDAPSGPVVSQEYKIAIKDARNPNDVKDYIELRSTGARAGTWPFSVRTTDYQTLQVTAFLPPFIVANSPDDKVKVRVYSDDFNYAEVTIAPNDSISAGALAKVSLQALPADNDLTPLDIDYSKWISPFTTQNPDILVSQLSIPGSHASAALGIAQSMTVADQWDAGVRVFDFRSAVRVTTQQRRDRLITWGDWYDYPENQPVIEQALYSYHNGKSIKTLQSDLNTILAKVASDAHREFAIVLLGYETSDSSDPSTTQEYGGLGDTYQLRQSYSKASIEVWKAEMRASLSSLVVEHPDNICTEFRPDLTLGDLANKILFITLDQYDGAAPIGAFAAAYPNQTAPAISDFYLNPDWTLNAKSANGADGKVQDCNVFSNDNTKSRTVMDLLDQSSATLSAESSKTVWFLNHASGFNRSYRNDPYKGYLTYADEDESYSNRNGREDYIDHISGPAGILMMDFAGEGGSIRYDFITYRLKGQELLQAVVKNNYTYGHLTK